jgi:hypothetical protein
VDGSHALTDLARDRVEVDDFESQAIGLQLGAHHVAQAVAAAVEPSIAVRRSGSLEAMLVDRRARGGAARGLEGRRELVGETGGEGTDRAQAVDARLALLRLEKPALQAIERAREPGGQDPEE